MQLLVQDDSRDQFQEGGDGWLKKVQAKFRNIGRKKQIDVAPLHAKPSGKKTLKPQNQVPAVGEREPLLQKAKPVSLKHKGFFGLFRGKRKSTKKLITKPVMKNPTPPNGYSAYKRSVAKYTKDEFDLFDKITKYDAEHKQNNLVAFITSILDWLQEHPNSEKSLGNITKCRNIELFQFIRNFFNYFEETQQVVASNKLDSHMITWFRDFFQRYEEKGITETAKTEIATTLLLAYMTWYQQKYSTAADTVSTGFLAQSGATAFSLNSRPPGVGLEFNVNGIPGDMKDMYVQVSKYFQKNVDSRFIIKCAEMYKDYLAHKCKEFGKCDVEGQHMDSAKKHVSRNINEFVLFDKIGNFNTPLFIDNFKDNINKVNAFAEEVYRLATAHIKTQRNTQRNTQQKTQGRAANQGIDDSCRTESLYDFIYNIMVDNNGNDENPDKFVSKLQLQSLEQTNADVFAIPFTLNSKPTPGGREFSEKAVAPDWATNNSPVLTVYIKLLLAYLIWYEDKIKRYKEYKNALQKLEEVTPEDETNKQVIQFFAENQKNRKIQNIVTKCNSEYTKKHELFTNIPDSIKKVNAKVKEAFAKLEESRKLTERVKTIRNVDTNLSPKTQTAQESASLEEATKLLEQANFTNEKAENLFEDVKKLYAKIIKDISAAKDQPSKTKGSAISGELDADMTSATKIKSSAEDILGKATHLSERKAALLLTIAGPQTTSPLAQRTKSLKGKRNTSKRPKKTTTSRSMQSEVEIQIRQIADEAERITNTINKTATKILYIAVSAKNCVLYAKEAYDLINNATKLETQVEDLETKHNKGKLDVKQLKKLASDTLESQKTAISILDNMSTKNAHGAVANIVYQPETTAKEIVFNIARKANYSLTSTNTLVDILSESVAKTDKLVDTSDMKLQTHQEDPLLFANIGYGPLAG